jgi:ABC-type amino acid transport substrate-binding protein
LHRGEPLRVAGLDLTAEPQPFDSLQIIDGFNRAVVNEMARRWGVAVVETPKSAGEAGVRLLTDGQTDIVVGLRADRSQMSVVSFSEPYYARALRLVHLRDVTVNGIGDLEFKPSMIIEPVDVSRDLVEDNNGNPEIQQAASYQEAFGALTNRIVNAVVGDEFALVLMSQANDQIVFDERRYRPVNDAMAVSSFDSDLLSLINFTLQDMYQDGTLTMLQQQYLAPYLPSGETLGSFELELWPGNGSFLGFPTSSR